MLSDGSHRELSIIETFEQAGDIRSIDGDMPLQRFALSRLLVAMLYGRFGHDLDVDDWKSLYDYGAGNPSLMQAILEYCDEWRYRFDLFDDRYPFYQVAGLHTAKHETSGLERLILDVPSGEPFFTTRMGDGLQSIRAAEAARWLVTVQAYDASGIKSGAVGDPRVKGGKGYPIGVAWTGHLGGYLVEGTNLWQTLMLNYVSQDVFESGEAASVQWDDDKPVWEREPLTQQATKGFDQPVERTGDTSFFHGPATLMTWQGRRMLLVHDDETVTGVLVCNGDRLKPQNAQHHEPMTAWRRSPTQEKALKRPVVYMPRKHDPSRALWRGLPLLLATHDSGNPTGGDDFIRPYSLKWLSKACPERSIPVRLHAFGVEYGNNDAVIDATVDDTLDISLVVLTTDNPQMGQMIQDAVDKTDQGIRALRNLAANIALSEGKPTEAPQQRAAELGYSAFDGAFRQWLRGIDHDDNPETLSRDWYSQARQLLQRLGSHLAGQASPKAIVGRDVNVNGTTQHYSAALAEIWFRSRVNGIFNQTATERANHRDSANQSDNDGTNA
ncbi:type I-E CRISPR-associated protein Cse1/CasA [Bifidobacterium amazonense]|uniref:Type I-E CRISPR-associated protein Cse1/CasA n=2 Tax=Bifidobacterium amazonense TaxID=2809027 RepID=A0ABS9VVQ0_9BIFI|nr:type I-E CRISPR-associated protein Cse1/CasA [Bifidobacterium amazonense]